MKYIKRTTLIVAGLMLMMTGCSETPVNPVPTAQDLDAPVGMQTVEISADDIPDAPAISLGKSLGDDDDVIFDQGPNSGSLYGCYSNQTHWQNFAEQFSFDTDTEVDGIIIYTCIQPRPGDVHIKILENAGGNPGPYLYEEDRTPDSWIPNPEGPGYQVIVYLPTLFNAEANTIYWAGVSGNGFELGQDGVRTPGDHRMAQFNGRTFNFHTSVGDMMFQLLGVAGPSPTPPANQDPIADAGADQTLECEGPDGTSVTLDGSASSDADGDALTYSWTDGDGAVVGGDAIVTLSQALGAQTYTLTVDDGNGGTASDDVVIDVVDTTPPVIDLTVETTTIWSVNRRMILAVSGISAADICCDVTLDVAVSGTAGSSADWEIVDNGDGTTSVSLRAKSSGKRAKRSGKEIGDRIYTVTVSAIDCAGNVASEAVEVTVPHNVRKGK